ncbi:FecR family protein [Leeuwenhoekiella marinoflava]|uniref:FecR family protein n=2 Tax=Leeuwenhoekiella marinoflava TaxID=988 RepID=A0A4Q0PG64_9FLAO|nr:FecR family protein [Leeuwenhoekiella marinoflava]RXG25904.1 FecR family protein [Leeuwenhoekiella marinoflava]SHF28830.1 FecR family protein [Leeuwenhoekiella marinoflava DSM 3653]
MESKIEQTLIRYLTNTASQEDLRSLSDWIEKPSNKQELESFIKDYYTITYSINNPNTNLALQNLLTSIDKRKRLRHIQKRRLFSRYAAAILVILILIVDFQYGNYIFNSASTSSKQIKVGTDKATLTLEDGSEIQLGAKEIFQKSGYLTNGTLIEYLTDTKDSKESKEIAYHYLTVPRGGKFSIILSDGTKVWLNSDSRLKYPTQFKAGNSREVELEYGEAYFDVSSATKHEGASFIVYNSDQKVEVLGTEFNIKAYNDDADVLTTLVVGKIKLKVEEIEQVLEPGQQAKYDVNNNRIITKSIDIYNETSWKEGIFSFDNKSLLEITKVLSRWYDVEFNFLNENVRQEKFVGILSKNQDIDQILLQIKNLGIINNYKIEKNEIAIE